MPKVYVFLAPGFEEIEAITPIDILRRAGIEVTTVSITNSLNIEGAHQIIIQADTIFDEVNFNDADMLFLPGGMPGSRNLDAHEELKALLLIHQEKGTLLAAICAAPLVFGGLNLLDNKIATCFPGFEDKLMGAKTTSNPIEVDGNIITGKGAGVASLFGLKMVELLVSKEKANELKKAMFV